MFVLMPSINVTLDLLILNDHKKNSRAKLIMSKFGKFQHESKFISVADIKVCFHTKGQDTDPRTPGRKFFAFAYLLSVTSPYCARHGSVYPLNGWARAQCLILGPESNLKANCT